MCVAAMDWRLDSELRLVLLHNRDEFHARPTQPTERRLIGGCRATYGTDLVAGGTWLAVADDGRIAMVMNYRDGLRKTGTISRGALPIRYLSQPPTKDPMDLVAELRKTTSDYAPYALLSGSPAQGFIGFESVSNRTTVLSAGLHTMSNGGLNRGWPKERRLAAAMGKVLGGAEKLANGTVEETLLDLLRSEVAAPDLELPSTGVPLDIERAMSPVFVNHPSYGTRVSTLVIVRSDGSIVWLDRSFDAKGQQTDEHRFVVSRTL